MPGVYLNPTGELSLQAPLRFRARTKFRRHSCLRRRAVFCAFWLPSIAFGGCGGHCERQGDFARRPGAGITRANLGDSPQKPSPQEADILRLNVLHTMIQDEILQQQAAKLNLTASDEDVNAKLTEIKAPYTEDQFYNLLKQRNLTSGRLQARNSPPVDRNQADQQGDRVEDQHHRRADCRILRAAQGGIQRH